MENNISSDIIRGHIDTMILKFLEQKDNYGCNLYKLIIECTDNLYELKETSLYSALKRLEKEQSIISYWGDETSGGRRKYYKISNYGITKLRNNILEWEKIKIVLDKILRWEK